MAFPFSSSNPFLTGEVARPPVNPWSQPAPSYETHPSSMIPQTTPSNPPYAFHAPPAPAHPYYHYPAPEDRFPPLQQMPPPDVQFQGQFMPQGYHRPPHLPLAHGPPLRFETPPPSSSSLFRLSHTKHMYHVPRHEPQTRYEPPTQHVHLTQYVPPAQYKQLYMEQPHVVPTQQEQPKHSSNTAEDIGPVPRSFHLSMTGWKASEKLSLEGKTYKDWSAKVQHEVGAQPSAWCFLQLDHLPPHPDQFPTHYRSWIDLDMVVHSFISGTCAVTEREHFACCTTAAQVWDTIRRQHELRGPVGWVKVLKKLFSLKYDRPREAPPEPCPGKTQDFGLKNPTFWQVLDLKNPKSDKGHHYDLDPDTFSKTTTVLSDLNKVFWAGGPPDADQLLAIAMLTALSNCLDIVRELLYTPGLSIAMIKECLADLREFDDKPGGSSGTLYAVTQSSSSKELCSTQKCPAPGSHTWPYCTYPGGGMAGSSLDEACANRGTGPT
ncbi:hypothetical protein B0H10DRAFT_2239925 [Mycena sp. CBHHK59/15]|nr:hypothetical protein B0H10DRAFT_2239925 [Mycena sp. CBHHK59/15]